MNCRECRTHFEEWLDGELDAATTRAVQTHLDGCSACALRLAERRALAARLQAAEDLAARGLRPFSPAAPMAAGTASRPSIGRRWGLVAAAALVIGVGMLLILAPRQRESAASPPQGMTAEIHVQDNLHNREDAFITGRQQGVRFRIHVQVMVENNGHPG